MLPILGPAIGAAGSIGAAAIGADASRDAAEANYMIALLNYYQRQREQWEAKREARRVEAKQDLGMTDSRGNTVKFVPGVGWVSELSEQSRGMQGREDAERMMALAHDASIKRNRLDSNEKRQIEEGDYADAQLQRLRRMTPTNPDALEASMRDTMTQGVNRGFDAVQSDVIKQALRSRASNAGDIVADLGRKRAETIGDNLTEIRMKAKAAAPELDAAKMKGATDLYNLFATRASAMPGVSFAPSNIGDGSDMLAAARRNTGEDMGFKAASMEGMKFPYQPPNYGIANLLGSAGNSLSSMFGANNSQAQMNELIEAIKSRLGNTGTPL